jgi:hypothetical protein
MIRWEAQEPIRPDHQIWAGYSGEIQIGTVLQRRDGAIVYTTTDAVLMKGIAPTHGTAATYSAAKRKVESAWQLWLTLAGLQQIPVPPGHISQGRVPTADEVASLG